MISIVAEVKQKIQDAIEGVAQYFLPIEKKDSAPTPGDFIQEPIPAEPNEVLDWIQTFSLNQGIKSLIESLVNKTQLHITSFTSFTHGSFCISFNTQSDANPNEGFLKAAEIEANDLQLGDLIDVTEIGLSLSYEPSTKDAS